jgi:uncharacterized PurR-regulated membrane protein YhhQ (DUF165 family)
MSNAEAIPSSHAIGLGIAAMAVVVTVSNIAVQYQIGGWWTWGSFTFPIAFLVTDLINRNLGASAARKVVCVGFALAVVLSFMLADARIAMASGAAFLTAQLLDISIFDRLRRSTWWRAPLISSTLSSALDTALFFSLAFAGTEIPWVKLALGDYSVKIAMALLMLIPFRYLMSTILPVKAEATSA